MSLIHLSYQTPQLNLAYLKYTQTHQPTGGQNYPTQSLFYHKVFNISCNILNAVLKVKTEWLCGFRMVFSVSVVYPCDCVANWELWLTALPSISREDYTADG